MANFTAINNVYNYYLTTYAPKTDSRFDTHKKSELRGVYNSIVKMNKEAPLYIVDQSQETKEYAVGLKENARSFRNTIASLGGLTEEDLLDKKVAYSSNESLAAATYIGEDITGSGAPAFDLSVTKLATPQVNEGKMLPSDKMMMAPDTYSFDVGINGLNYEFQYNVGEQDTNRQVQEKLARLITNSNIGLTADVLSDGAGNSALRIQSVATGNISNGGRMFNISDENTGRTKGSVDYFGLNRVVQESSDAEFTINGIERHAKDNTFTVEKMYEISLNRVSSDPSDSTHIELKEDLESMASNIEKMMEGYNSFVDTATKYAEGHPKSGRLVREMYELAAMHAEEFKSLGISLEDDAHISLDKEELFAAASKEDISEKLGGLKKFAASMLRKANQVALNPMHYADRTIVAYKNPGHNYATPYVTSAYTGMMFNSYC